MFQEKPFDVRSYLHNEFIEVQKDREALKRFWDRQYAHKVEHFPIVVGNQTQKLCLIQDIITISFAALNNKSERLVIYYSGSSILGSANIPCRPTLELPRKKWVDDLE